MKYALSSFLLLSYNALCINLKYSWFNWKTSYGYVYRCSVIKLRFSVMHCGGYTIVSIEKILVYIYKVRFFFFFFYCLCYSDRELVEKQSDSLMVCESVSNTCSGNGQCVNSPRGEAMGYDDYYCKCNPGFSGSKCDQQNNGSYFIHSFTVL